MTDRQTDTARWQKLRYAEHRAGNKRSSSLSIINPLGSASLKMERYKKLDVKKNPSVFK